MLTFLAQTTYPTTAPAGDGTTPLERIILGVVIALVPVLLEWIRRTNKRVDKLSDRTFQMAKDAPPPAVHFDPLTGSPTFSPPAGIATKPTEKP